MSPASRKTKSENERPPSMAQTKTFKEATLSKTKKERLESSTSANRDKSKSKVSFINKNQHLNIIFNKIFKKIMFYK